VIVALSFAFAVASWHFVERPFRQAQGGVSRAGISGRRWRRARGGHLCRDRHGHATAARARAGVQLVNAPGESEYDAGGRNTCFLDTNQTFADWGGDRCFVTRGKGRGVLLWGDSFAAHYVPGLKHQADRCTPTSCSTTSRPAARVQLRLTLKSALPRLQRPCRRRDPDYEIESVIVASRWDYAFTRHVAPADIAATMTKLESLGVGSM
jgi:hypothetical protein